MTCVATDGKTIAADSRTCIGHLIISDAGVKLARGRDGSIIGIAGETGVAALVRDWFEKGESLTDIPRLRLGKDDDGFAAIALRPDGRVQYIEQNFTYVDLETPAAVGTGAEVAIGLILAGKSPGEAVEIVKTRVTSVGGPVVEWRCDKPGKARR